MARIGQITKRIPLRDWGVINHIQRRNAIEIVVELDNYDTYFDSPTSQTTVFSQFKQQLFNALKPN